MNTSKPPQQQGEKMGPLMWFHLSLDFFWATNNSDPLDHFLVMKESKFRECWYELKPWLKFIIHGSSNLVPQKIIVICPLQLFKVGPTPTNIQHYSADLAFNRMYPVHVNTNLNYALPISNNRQQHHDHVCIDPYSKAFPAKERHYLRISIY